MVALVGGAIGILVGLLWRGHHATRSAVVANAVLFMMLAGVFLVVIPRLSREKHMLRDTRRFLRKAAVADGLAGLALIGVGVFAPAPRPVLSYLLIGGGLILLVVSGVLWVAARRASDWGELPAFLATKRAFVSIKAGLSSPPGRRSQHAEESRIGEHGAWMNRRQRLGLAVILVWCVLVVLAIVVTGRIYLGAFLALAFLLALPFRARWSLYWENLGERGTPSAFKATPIPSARTINPAIISHALARGENRSQRRLNASIALPLLGRALPWLQRYAGWMSNPRAKDFKSLGKPPVNPLAFGVGSFIVAILASVMAVNLLAKGGTTNLVVGVVGLVGATCFIFLGILHILVWRSLRRQ
jgi:hypothetical protein